MFTDRVDEKWGLHEHRSPSANGSGNCLAFEIDPRFVNLPGHEDIRFRLAVSFGHNPFTPEMARGFVPPPIRPGKYVFGIHDIGMRGNRITVFDQWYDAREAPTDMRIENASDFARAILLAIPNNEYVDMLKEDRKDVAELQVEQVSDLDCLIPVHDIEL